MPTSVIVSFIVVAIFDLLFPLLLALWLKRRYHARWLSFFVGITVFTITQILIRIPIVALLGAALQDDLAASVTLRTAWLIGLSFSAGLFEEGGRYLGFRYVLRQHRTWIEGVLFGLGHGGIEAAFLGGTALINALIIPGLASAALPAEAAQQLQAAQAALAALTPWAVLAAAYERFWAIVLHVGLSLMVLRTANGRGQRWLWLAIVLHGLFNVVAVALNQRWGIAAAEASVTLFGIAALIFTLRERSAAPSALTPVAEQV
ncbi:MAG TPA: YhfC family glutamic-type intramembrane protease [Herpetosiphonaceae bacterium]